MSCRSVSPRTEDRKGLSGLLHFHKDLILPGQDCFGQDERGLERRDVISAFQKELMF